MEREAIVVYADNDPVPGISDPRPNQRYRNPQVKLDRKSLTALAADWIRVHMLYAGVCGTDVHLLQTDPQSGYIEYHSMCCWRQ
jgi:threonine dehydrogenase-like Zn-dependent dehydrogenase